MHVCLCTWWKPEKNLRRPETRVVHSYDALWPGIEPRLSGRAATVLLTSLLSSPFTFFLKSLTELGRTSLIQLASKPETSSYPTSPVLGLQGHATKSDFVCGRWRSRPRSSCMHSKNFTESPLHPLHQHFQLKHSPLQENVYLASKEWTWPPFNVPQEIIQANFHMGCSIWVGYEIGWGFLFFCTLGSERCSHWMPP